MTNDFDADALGQAAVDAYRRDGIVCLRQAFDPDQVAFLRDVAARDMAAPSRMSNDATRDGTGRFFSDTFVHKHIAELGGIVRDSRAADVACALMRTKKVNLIFDQFLIKAPGTSTRTVWHHDATYWPVAGDMVATLWLALDPVTMESGAVEYVKGSHRWGQRYKAESFIDKDLYKEDLPPVPDIEAMRDELDIVAFEMAPGDCTIHHGLTVHGAPGNARDDLWRRAYVMRWAGEDVTYNPRPNLQPMLFDPQIPAGGPLDSELFPVIRP
ncbi:Ectoine hydroxylase-related dioxygenase, phytanoyl-CoA dioxygenase (PhyH) family [Tistlia consotensis]|uniref:Ectoine hydroxylase-related dioxygenase, phytanoyl-CoA dioxygenase (PhyH) family n=1 Tax=Tistlia consotensis USBA 355 TaxID=560819 RepID=A0A1Y6CN53_9PROT|nr:phytanoyl-CoA dioxygenase family protein [Tistlia consotensis]SMF79155.1 Ectoine hydroxylase-related dioxygenase, phytanoyl-CoA dioxygenase (PhyH) family [Tistlia consotensis USBA 355]SNS15961.1 Ectoine hydroxylase-related dioxygenase, phytanoyl-CoA dioxygenase (PhyH) family [Tistlia consotensis]